MWEGLDHVTQARSRLEIQSQFEVDLVNEKLRDRRGALPTAQDDT